MRALRRSAIAVVPSVVLRPSATVPKGAAFRAAQADLRKSARTFSAAFEAAGDRRRTANGIGGDAARTRRGHTRGAGERSMWCRRTSVPAPAQRSRSIHADAENKGFLIVFAIGRRQRQRPSSAAEGDRGGGGSPSSAIGPATDRPTPPLRRDRRTASAAAHEGWTRRRRTREEWVKRHGDHGRCRPSAAAERLGSPTPRASRRPDRASHREPTPCLARRPSARRGVCAGTNGGGADAEHGTDFAASGHESKGRRARRVRADDARHPPYVAANRATAAATDMRPRTASPAVRGHKSSEADVSHRHAPPARFRHCTGYGGYR